MNPASKFYFIGFGVAALEEFITQGVLKNNLTAWIIPTFVAFLPFLFIVRTAGKLFDRCLSTANAAIAYYLTAGGIGLAVEWFLIGLSPWNNPSGQYLAMSVLQIGMFSFWCGVAFAPRLLLDERESVSKIRIRFTRFLISGIAVIYLVTWAAPKSLRFPAGIGSVILAFTAMNGFYFQYFRTLRLRENA